MAPLESRVSVPRGPRPSDCERRRRRRRRRHLTARLRCKRETATASRQSHPSWGSTASVANATYPTPGPRRAQRPGRDSDARPRCTAAMPRARSLPVKSRSSSKADWTPARDSWTAARDSRVITRPRQPTNTIHCSPNSRTTQPPGRLDSLLAPKPQARPRPLPAHGGWWQWCVEAWV